jgi:hypothetical protein
MHCQWASTITICNMFIWGLAGYELKTCMINSSIEWVVYVLQQLWNVHAHMVVVVMHLKIWGYKQCNSPPPRTMASYSDLSWSSREMTDMEASERRLDAGVEVGAARERRQGPEDTERRIIAGRPLPAHWSTDCGCSGLCNPMHGSAEDSKTHRQQCYTHINYKELHKGVTTHKPLFIHGPWRIALL